MLSNNTVVVTGEDNGKGYDWDSSRYFYFNWLKSLQLPAMPYRRLTQFNVSNGRLTYSKVTDSEAVSEVTVDEICCPLTCAW